MRRLLILIIILSFLTGCGSTAATPTSTVTLAPSSTATKVPTSTLTPTSSPTLTPTLTPTITPTPTRTPLPTATPTPQGFYTSELGFSLVLPDAWSVVNETDTMVIFDSATGATRLVAGALPSSEEPLLSDFLTGICGGFSPDYTTYEVEEDEEYTVADGSILQRTLFSCKSQKSNAIQLEILTRQKGYKFYIFMVSSSTRHITPSQLQMFHGIYNTISLSSAVIYGLPRAETLLRLGYDPEPEDLDPALGQSSAADYTGLLYSGLVRLTPELQIVGDLAQNWAISSDGLVYTFTLKSGLTFADGQPLTATDVKYSWERAADPATDSPTSITYLGDISGFKERRDGKADDVSGIGVIDDLTLQVTLTSPVQYFLAKLTYPVAFVVSKAAVEANTEEWMFHPNASGPYSLKELKPDELIVFERNDKYYEPALIRYVAYKTDAPGTSLSYYETGETDIAYPSLVDIEEIQAPDHPLHDQMSSASSMCTDYIMLNNSLPPMDDPNVRLALTLAIDKDKIIEQFYNNMIPRADTLLPPGMPGYSEFPAQKFDPQAARDALAASTYAGKVPELTINIGGYAGDDTSYVDALIAMWQENLNIKVKIAVLDPIFYSTAAREGHGQMVMYAWCADYPDPSNFLDVLFHSKSDLNVAEYSNPQVDTLLEQARTEPNPETRLSLYNQVESMLLDDHAAIPLNNSTFHNLVNPRVHGYSITPIGVKIIPYMWLAAP